MQHIAEVSPILLDTCTNHCWRCGLNKNYYSKQFTDFLQMITVIVILRTYALYELNKRVAIGMATVAFLVICFGVVSL